MREKWHSALIVSGIYAIFGTLWIIITDNLVDALFDDFRLYSTVKGLIFILLSTGVIYVSVYAQMRHHKELEAIINAEIKKKTAYKKTLEEQNKRLFKLVDESPVPMLLHSENKRILRISKTFLEKTKYTQDELPTMNAWVKKAYRDQSQKVMNHIETLYSINTKLYEGTFSLKTKDDQTLLWDFYSSYIGRDDKGLRNIISLAIDITDYKQKEADLDFLTYHDDLTRAYNARYLKRYTDEISEEPYVIILADMIGLNKINKTYGRYKGDAVIKLFANLLKSHLPKSSIVARIGGDAFCTVVRQYTNTSITPIIKTIKEQLTLLDFEDIKLDARFLTKERQVGEHFETLLGELEHAMFEIKRR
jgi:diguanylate cyclase (GGDEF)-like protein/PAS domain S-box-containing protein